MTGEVRSNPSSPRFWTGKFPCQILAMCLPPGISASPQANSSSSRTAARGELPLRLRRQILAGPARIGHGIAIGDVDDGMVVEASDIAAGPIGMAPIGAAHEGPPLAPVGEIRDARQRREHQPSRRRAFP